MLPPDTVSNSLRHLAGVFVLGTARFRPSKLLASRGLIQAPALSWDTELQMHLEMGQVWALASGF